MAASRRPTRRLPGCAGPPHKRFRAIGPAQGGYALSTADRLFGQLGATFQQDFLSLVEADYGAALAPVDFLHSPDAARATINAWVADETDQEITELLGPGDISSSTVLAIVFKGGWDAPMDPTWTAAQSFRRLDGSHVEVEMMTPARPFATAKTSDASVYVVPFAGRDLSMVVVLPSAPDGLPAVEARLGTAGLADVIDDLDATDDPEAVALELPRFNLASSFALVPALGALGVTSAFEPGVADFSPIDGGRDLALQSVAHQAQLSIDETGAVASAATGGGVEIDAVSGNPVRADHPFLVLIYDHVTHSILFMGRVADPTAS